MGTQFFCFRFLFPQTSGFIKKDLRITCFNGWNDSAIANGLLFERGKKRAIKRIAFRFPDDRMRPPRSGLFPKEYFCN
ncbi:hypothetical protein CH380_06930 [Leptospira adleri]|uniref:Uncharacterized protein n=1 Tax=Leptospira adleri TaxID=2023186 RepID=A0A2M9YRV5_9LEPT|nr:hypothetical protein CH380_06930 [Leptospira adleri]PJZ62389.1 hypothetical protein CH376_08540 [Leptospira adleri]